MLLLLTFYVLTSSVEVWAPVVDHTPLFFKSAENPDPVVFFFAISGFFGSVFQFPKKVRNQQSASRSRGDGEVAFAKQLAVAKAERSRPSVVFILEMGGDVTDELVEHLQSELLSKAGDGRLTFFKVH